jgi:hypothetical protein
MLLLVLSSTVTHDQILPSQDSGSGATTTTGSLFDADRVTRLVWQWTPPRRLSVIPQFLLLGVMLYCSLFKAARPEKSVGLPSFILLRGPSQLRRCPDRPCQRCRRLFSFRFGRRPAFIPCGIILASPSFNCSLLRVVRSTRPGLL